MKRVVSIADYRYSDIKPEALFDEFLALSAAEIRRLLLDGAALEPIDCPACASGKRKPAFDKFGLAYVECAECGTLFISPRPAAAKLARYARESAANAFWSSRLLKETRPARVEHLTIPEVDWVANTTEEMIDAPGIFADVRSRSVEFLKAVDQLKLFESKVLVDPGPAVADALPRSAGFEIIAGDSARLRAVEADVVTSFYALDSAHDPRQLLSAMKSMLVRGGLLFLIGSTISGLDLQVLWDRARTLIPPENLNVLSIEGVTRLLESSGFEILELSTPGHLDVEYIKAALARDEAIPIPRFLSYLIKRRDENAHRALQEWLQEFRLSSHLRVVARRT